MQELITINKKEVKSEYKINDAYSFYKFIESISKMITEFQIEVKQDRIFITFMDPSRISLCNITIENTLDSKIDIYKEGKYPLNAEDLTKILKVLKGDKKWFEFRFKDSKIEVDKIKSNGFKASKTLETIELEIEEIPIENLEKIVYPSKIGITKVFVEDLFKELGTYSECIEISINKNGVFFSELGNLGNSDLEITSEYLEDHKYDEQEQKSAYSLTFLRLIKNLLPIITKEQIINFELKTEHPIKLSTIFENLGINFTLWIAPRVEIEDEDEDFF